jgi:hypothetical protein
VQLNETKRNQVIETSKNKTTDTRWLNAINKAAEQLRA